MATVVRSGRRAVVDPLKLSRPLGAVLALLGLAESLPLMHGSQGCTAFAKAFLTKHFREPIPLQTSAVTELTAVLGSSANLISALDTVRATLAPRAIGVITTGVSEASGEDLDAELRGYRAGLTDPDDPLVFLIKAPDFVGGLSQGWSGALTAIVEAALRDGPRLAARRSVAGSPFADRSDAGPVPAAENLMPVLAGVSLTAADLDEIGTLIEAFGLTPLLVPDLSGSMDGHLGTQWRPLSGGGTPVGDLALLAEAPFGEAIGLTTKAAAQAWAHAGTDVPVRDHLSGLTAVDGLVERLWRRTGVDVPHRVRRDRARLADTLLDTHFVLGGARVAVAAEPELLVAVCELLAATGAQVVAAVSPTGDPALAAAACDEVVIGDLADLRERAASGGAEVVIGSSHAAATAAAIKAGHLPLGLPIDHRYGATLATVAGYRGGLRFVTELANQVLIHRESAHAGPAHHLPPGVDRTGADRPSARLATIEESLC